MIKEMLGPLAGRIIDSHCHIAEPIPDPSREGPEKLVRLIRHYGVGRAIFLGNITGMVSGPDPGPQLIADGNTYTLKLMERYPDIFIGFCYLNPMNPDSFTLEEIQRCIAEGPMKGIKLLTAANARRRRLDPIMARAGDLRVPVVNHSWYKTVWMGDEESNPGDMADLARRWPNVNIILAHMGGGRERGVLDLVDMPNMYYDTAGSFPEADLVEYAVRKLGAEHIVFGVDWPCRDFGVQIARVLAADVTDEQREMIFRGNLIRLLDLEDE